MHFAPELLDRLLGTPPVTITSAAVSLACGTRYAVGPNGALSALEPMSKDVIQELEVMRHENPAEYPTIESVIFHRVPKVSTFDERKATTRDTPKDYFLSTEMNFDYAMSKIPSDGQRVGA